MIQIIIAALQISKWISNLNTLVSEVPVYNLTHFVSTMEPVDLLPNIGLKLVECFSNASTAFCFED